LYRSEHTLIKDFNGEAAFSLSVELADGDNGTYSLALQIFFEKEKQFETI
jgi:hypothetical protein